MNASVSVRPVTPEDATAWIRMRTALWPEWPEDHPEEVDAYLVDPPEDASCLVAEDADGAVVGFAEVGLRRWAEGCSTSPVAYLEGIWVEPDRRREGVGRALVQACEAWGRSRGCVEMGSDRALTDEGSGAFHEGAGFDEVHRVVCYRKEL